MVFRALDENRDGILTKEAVHVFWLYTFHQWTPEEDSLIQNTETLTYSQINKISNPESPIVFSDPYQDVKASSKCCHIF